MSKMIKNGRNTIDNFLRIPDNSRMSNLISYSRENDLNDEEILYLANGLANSGARMTFNIPIQACDIPSTGGPSSLSTLLCPLFLRISGNNVLK